MRKVEGFQNISNIHLGIATKEPIQGYLWEYLDEQFIIHKADENEWQVTHLETGASVSFAEFTTRKQAIEHTIRFLDRQGKDNLIRVIDRAKDIIENLDYVPFHKFDECIERMMLED